MMLRLYLVASLASLALVGPAAAQSVTPLSFEQAVDAAEPAAESVIIARADAERARAQVTAATAGYLPVVNGALIYQRTLATEFDDIVFGPPGTGEGELTDLPFGQPNNWRMNLQVTQPILDFRTPNAVAQAKAGARAADLGVRANRAQVVLAAAAQYLDAALAQRQIEIAEATLQQAVKTYEETELGFKQGAMPEFDLLRAEVTRDNQRALVVQFTVQRDVELVELRRLVGMPVDKPIELTTKIEANDVEQLLASARKAAGITSTNRLAVAQAKEQVAAREAGVRLARSDFFPILSAGTDLGFVNYENQPINTDWRTNWTIGATLSIPIFDGFRRQANVRAARADLSASKASLEFTREVSDVELAQARANVDAARTQLEISERTVKQARRAYQIAELRFSQGASTYLDIADARVQLEQSLLVQARASRDLRLALLRETLLPALPIGSLVF
jgi:outer membrane protein TolC